MFSALVKMKYFLLWSLLALSTLSHAADTGCGVTGVPIDPFGEENIWNSTYTTLDPGDSFIGCIRKGVVEAPFLMVQVFSDAPGQLFGQFSVDGRNIDSTYPTAGWSTAANIPEVHCISLGNRFWRLKYTNNSSVQTIFRMGVYEVNEPCGLQASYNNTLGLDADAIATRPSDFQEEVSLDRREGVTGWKRFGFRNDLDAADGAALITSDDTTNIPTILSSPSTFTVTYNQATDGEGTTGALTLSFFYLDATGAEAESTHTLGSDGSDITSFSGMGINRTLVLSSGSADTNTSNINITATTGGSVQSFVPAGLSVTQTLLHHVPLNGRGVVNVLFVAANRLSGANPIVIFRGISYSRSNDTEYEIFKYTMDTQSKTSLLFPENIILSLDAGTVFYITAETTNNDTIVEGKFSLNTYQLQ